MLDPLAPLAAPTVAARSEPARRLLLIEDDALFAAHLAEQLACYGYQCFLLPGSNGLCAALEQIRPEALLVDVILGDQGENPGPEMIEAARRAGIALPPILFISSRDDLSARLAALRAGGQGYFPKPIDVPALIDRLDALSELTPDQPYRVLIIDDTIAVAETHAAILRSAGMAVHVINDPLQAEQAIAEFSPELLLLDMYMPGCSGSELAAVLRQNPQHVSLPIVFISVERNIDKQLAAMMIGGDDFLTKPVSPERLEISIAARVARYRQLNLLMTRDSLTGLLNHSAIAEAADKEAFRARRLQQMVSVAMLDLDHFKQVNDTHGHPVGDRVIKSLSRLLTQRLRKSDAIGRYGGEEFAVVLPDTSAQQAVALLDDIRQAFAQIEQQAKGAKFAVSLSCGIASSTCSNGSALLQVADEALYAAKHQGRNRVTSLMIDPKHARLFSGNCSNE